MKTALVVFFNPKEKPDFEYLTKLSQVFYSGGVQVDKIEMLSNTDDLGFKRRLTELKDVYDLVVATDGENVKVDVKKIVSEMFDTELLENQNAKKFLDAVKTASGINYSDDYAVIPLSSTVIPNIEGAYQGFMLDDEKVTLAVLPNVYEQFLTACGKYVIPYVENKYNVKAKRQLLKFIGDRNLLNKTLMQAEQLFGSDFKATVTNVNGDYTIDLLFKGNAITESANVVRYIVSELKDDIYAEFETTPESRLFDLLKLKKLKLSVAESFTGGRLASSMIKNSGVSEFFYEGIVAYSNKSKIERLGVEKEDLARSGAVSSIVAYQMCAGLLRKGDCDIAIATTGIAGPKSDDTDKPVGLCYIAVGLKDGVHTYKYNFNGTREQITEQARNVALGLAIKKLKKI